MESQSSIPFKVKAGLALFGLLVSAALIEIAFRVLAPHLKAPAWTDRPYGYFLPSTAPSLQDDERRPKAPSTFRIAAVGDSFTFGPNLQLSDTYPKKIEAALNLNAGAPRVEVLNRGVCGNSTADEVRFVGRALAENPDLIILNITLNDAEPHILSGREREALFGASYLKWKLWNYWRSGGYIAARFHNSQSVKNYIDYHTKFFKLPETLARFENALTVMQQMAAEKKVPLLAVVFPLFDFPIDARYPFAEVHRIVAEVLTRQKIPHIDLKDAYADIPPLRLQVIPGVDNHPNEIAHRIAAETIVAALVERKLIPEAAIPLRIYPKRLDARGAPTRDRAKLFRRALHPEHRKKRAERAQKDR